MDPSHKMQKHSSLLALNFYADRKTKFGELDMYYMGEKTSKGDEEEQYWW